MISFNVTRVVAYPCHCLKKGSTPRIMVDTIYKTFDKNRSKREDEHSIAKYVIYNVETDEYAFLPRKSRKNECYKTIRRLLRINIIIIEIPGRLYARDRGIYFD